MMNSNKLLFILRRQKTRLFGVGMKGRRLQDGSCNRRSFMRRRMGYGGIPRYNGLKAVARFIFQLFLLSVAGAADAAFNAPPTVEHIANVVNGMWSRPTRAEVRAKRDENVRDEARRAFIALMKDTAPECNQQWLVAFTGARMLGFKPKCLKSVEQLMTAGGAVGRSAEHWKVYMNKKNMLLTSSCAELARLCDRALLKKAVAPLFNTWVMEECAQWPDDMRVPFPQPETPVQRGRYEKHWGIVDAKVSARLFQHRPALIVLDFLIGQKADDPVGLNWRRPVINEMECCILPDKYKALIDTRARFDRYMRMRDDNDRITWLMHTSFMDRRTDPLLALREWEKNRSCVLDTVAVMDDAESDYTRQEGDGVSSGAVLSHDYYEEDEDLAALRAYNNNAAVNFLYDMLAASSVNDERQIYVKHTHPSVTDKQRALRPVCMDAIIWRLWQAAVRESIAEQREREKQEDLERRRAECVKILMEYQRSRSLTQG